MRKVLLLAGEESGLLYARQIADRLRALWPEVEIRGYEDYGFQVHDLAVIGLIPVLKKLFYFLRVKRTMEEAIATWRPDVVCTVDYPGMNLKLAAYAKARGIRAVHVVCPQVWAWKAGRIPKIEASLDHLCCFFPFEPKLFKPGFAEFVGHPLATAFADAKVKSEDRSSRPLRVALLPGSRIGEIERILPTILKAIDGLKAEFVIPAAHERAEKAIRKVLDDVKPSVAPSVQLGGARELLRAADCAVVASGTATLEAALARCPTVLVYRIDAVMGVFLRFAIKNIRHVGLANIIWEKCDPAAADKSKMGPMPELLQEKMTPEAIRAKLEPWLIDESARLAASRALDAAMAFLSSEGEPIDRIVRTLEK